MMRRFRLDAYLARRVDGESEGRNDIREEVKVVSVSVVL
jgi:hypothetical protein